MAKQIYYLRFTTPFRFGGDGSLDSATITCHGDTLFSAMVIEWLRLFGADCLAELIKAVESNRFVLSDLLPYQEETLYLVKPVVLKHHQATDKNRDSTSLKAEKKIKYVKAADLAPYFKSCAGGVPFLLEKEPVFAYPVKRVRVGQMNVEKPEPYFIAACSFYENCGLYLIAEVPEELNEKMTMVLESLGETGIGGKKSSGYGKFQLIKSVTLVDPAPSEQKVLTGDEQLLQSLLTEPGRCYINLAPLLPELTQLDAVKKGSYQLIRRKGFVYSDSFTTSMVKKKPVTLIDTGGCFSTPLSGRLVNVGEDGSHPVYRNGKSLWLGVAL